MWMTLAENKYAIVKDPNLYAIMLSIDGFQSIELEKAADKIIKLKLKTNKVNPAAANDIKELATTNQELNTQVVIKNGEFEIDANCSNLLAYLNVMRDHMKSRSAQQVVKSIFNTFGHTVTPMPMAVPLQQETSKSEASWSKQLTDDGIIYNVNKLQIILTKDTKNTPKILTVVPTEMSAKDFQDIVEPILAEAKKNNELSYQQTRETPKAAVTMSSQAIHLLVDEKNFNSYFTKIAGIIGKENVAAFKAIGHDLAKPKSPAAATQDLTAPGTLSVLPPPTKAPAKQPNVVAPAASKRRKK